MLRRHGSADGAPLLNAPRPLVALWIAGALMALALAVIGLDERATPRAAVAAAALPAPAGAAEAVATLAAPGLL